MAMAIRGLRDPDETTVDPMTVELNEMNLGTNDFMVFGFSWPQAPVRLVEDPPHFHEFSPREQRAVSIRASLNLSN
jgi:hypothetical protein